MESVERFVRLIEYEAWCTPRVAVSLRRAEANVKETGLAALVAPLDRAVEIFSHTQAAKQVWLSRVSKLAVFPDEGVFPVWPLDKAERAAKEMDRLWGEFARGQTAVTLADVVEYTSTEGVACESLVADVLSHVVNHGTYHRGQIALLVAQTGTRPPATDFVLFTRRTA